MNAMNDKKRIERKLKMTDGFTRRKEQSKEDIRKAAWELFSQFGVEKVSMVDIAVKAGVAQATIYNNFGSKEALAREFVTTVVDQLVNRVQEVLSHDQPYWEKMAAFIQFISEMMASARPPEGDVVWFTRSYDLQNDPEIKKIHDSAQERMTNLLLELVRQGKEQGQINSNLSEEAYRVYFKAFMDIFIAPQFQNRYYKDPQLVQGLGSLMIYGLSGQHK
jgi:AcrR family transcriptional regulator